VPVDIQKFSHVVLRVDDMATSLAFYRDLLGFSVVFEKGPDDLPEGAPKVHVAGCLPDGGVVIELMQNPGMPPAGPPDGNALIAFSVADIETARAQTEAAGVPMVPPPTEMMPGIKMMFVRDPDGRMLEFVEFAGEARSSAENAAKS
jgi:catechol 2,3-dioxygenase-like lactoylglutathione lyase family enzyme